MADAKPTPATGEGKSGSFLGDLFAPIAGFGVTFSTMFRKVATEEYPEVKRPTAPRFHGRHQLNRHPDGLEKWRIANKQFTDEVRGLAPTLTDGIRGPAMSFSYARR